MLGGDTLFELRSSLQLAQQERMGGISPHISPMVNFKDVGGLLSQAGFTLTTIDLDEIQIGYPSIYELVADLNAMGEGNAIAGTDGYLGRDVLLAADAVYKSVYGDKDGIPATFQVIFMVRKVG
jgi:NADH dehydrogenase [ubiquinone] 1 alpha subcomplex assembly factor 5